ncbi:hypothetical protein B0T14DRAFT_282232 [Immersiella caudata]|uniref:Uncharacterized protein n=1 Tax=Immersiella caudata TaxID=314043 RepID=A0AA39WDW7_9PEZI|nr:hypothetical protein B0T14DRAFT_282232 [Immersiella caudata]
MTAVGVFATPLGDGSGRWFLYTVRRSLGESGRDMSVLTNCSVGKRRVLSDSASPYSQARGGGDIPPAKPCEVVYSGAPSEPAEQHKTRCIVGDSPHEAMVQRLHSVTSKDSKSPDATRAAYRGALRDFGTKKTPRRRGSSFAMVEIAGASRRRHSLACARFLLLFPSPACFCSQGSPSTAHQHPESGSCRPEAGEGWGSLQEGAARVYRNHGEEVPKRSLVSSRGAVC